MKMRDVAQRQLKLAFAFVLILIGMHGSLASAQNLQTGGPGYHTPHQIEDSKATFVSNLQTGGPVSYLDENSEAKVQALIRFCADSTNQEVEVCVSLRELIAQQLLRGQQGL